MTDKSELNYNKKYYRENKEKWLEYQDCQICGGKYNKSSRYNHFKN